MRSPVVDDWEIVKEPICELINLLFDLLMDVMSDSSLCSYPGIVHVRFLLPKTANTQIHIEFKMQPSRFKTQRNTKLRRMISCLCPSGAIYFYR